MQKILRDTNLILKFLNENRDLASSLFDCLECNNSNVNNGYSELEPQIFSWRQLDFLYKTRWILSNDDYNLIGILGNNHIISYDEYEFYYCCTGFQHFPYYHLNKWFDGYSQDKILSSGEFSEDIFKDLVEYEKFCKCEKICIQEYYQQFFNKNCPFPHWTNRLVQFNYENIENFDMDIFHEKQLSIKKYPVIRREKFKPLVRLEQPRVLNLEEEYIVESKDGIFWQD